MIDEMLRNAICRILYRVHPAPLRVETLESECEIALGRVLTREEFRKELKSLQGDGIVKTATGGALGPAETALLTATGWAECQRVFG